MFCSQCGSAVSADSHFCQKCGSAQTPESSAESVQARSASQPTRAGTGPSGQTIGGVLAIVAAIGIYFWAHAHSPHMGFGEMLANYDGWVIREPFYSIAMIVAVLVAIIGGINIYRGLQPNQAPPRTPPCRHRFFHDGETLSCMDCGEIRVAGS